MNLYKKDVEEESYKYYKDYSKIKLKIKVGYLTRFCFDIRFC